MIKLLDILKTVGVEPHNWKIHLATGSNPGPLQAYRDGWFKKWQEEQGKKNFQCEMVAGLIDLPGDLWLFGGVYRVLDVAKGTNTAWRYQTELLPNQDDLIGRVIIRYKRRFRASYIRGERYGHLLEVAEIRPSKMTIEPFPGYDDVVISHDHLRMIVREQNESWKSALSSVKGVYVIADTSTGQLYVGSATGTEGIWQRWMDYAKSGHGANQELMALLQKNGDSHRLNFRYSVLEIADFHATDRDIKEREEHWKRALVSRDQGLNRN